MTDRQDFQRAADTDDCFGATLYSKLTENVAVLLLSCVRVMA
jgi:hypothetical protein